MAKQAIRQPRSGQTTKPARVAKTKMPGNLRASKRGAGTSIAK